MGDKEKLPEWKVIAEAERRAGNARTASLRAERLARDAALPPEAPKARGRSKKKPL